MLSLFPDDSVSMKDGRISGVALVSACGSSKDGSHDPLTYPSAETPPPVSAGLPGCGAQRRPLSHHPRAGCLRIKVCAER